MTVIQLPNANVQGWSPDGRFILYNSVGAQTNFDIWMVPVSGDRTPVALVRTPAGEGQARVSADGRWLAYVSDETGDAEIYVQRFDGQSRLRVSSGGGREPRWRADGRELFYRAPDDRLMAVAATPGPVLRIEAARPLFRLPLAPGLSRTKYLPSRDGQRFLVVTPIDKGAPPRIDVILNWTALLTDH